MGALPGSAAGWLIAAAFAIYTTSEVLSYHLPIWIIFISILATILLGIAINVPFLAEPKEERSGKGLQIAANSAFGAAFLVGSITRQGMFDELTLAGLRFMIIGSGIQMTLFATSAALTLWHKTGTSVRVMAVLGVIGPLCYSIAVWVVIERLVAGTMGLEEAMGMLPWLAGFIAPMALAGMTQTVTYTGAAPNRGIQGFEQARRAHATSRGLPPTAVMVHPPRYK